jgi:flagellin-specific chaperone FliS
MRIAEAPDDAIPVTCERLQVALQGAARAHGAGDPVLVKQELDGALSLVVSLLGTLNYKPGGEYAPRLADLLGYFVSEILVLMHAMDADALARLIEMMDVVNGQWRSSSSERTPTTQRGGQMHINGKIVGSITGPSLVNDTRTLYARDSQISDLDPHQEAVIRQRIVDGAYDALEIVDQVARRILDSGDL